MAGWNFANLWERIADRFPDSLAQVQGDQRSTWAEFDRRADGVASYLRANGASHQDKVALYLYNCPQYMEGCFGAYKASMVPVNTNYRYLDDELLYLWDNADAVAVIFHGVFVPRVEAIRSRLENVKVWIWVDDGSGARPDWAVDYEEVARSASGRYSPPEGRSGDDITMIYTGGTTGMPKGVMWRQDDLIRATVAVGNPSYLNDPEEIGAFAPIDALPAPGPPGLPACPLMHGTGWYTANMYLTAGGSVVLLEDRTFDVAELLDTIQREKVAALTIVGDAFARPIVNAMDAEPDRWDISSLVLISSSGVMWSEPIKKRLLSHNPGMLLLDSFSSSEAIGMGASVSMAGAERQTAKFDLGNNVRVVGDNGTFVEPGSGERGRVAIPGYVPLGYYKDAEKTAATFLQIDGTRYSIPGDFATVEADGSITLLGRGSVCINTAGEKVFPEEVEESLKTHPNARDAVVVGVPDEKYGEAITALVEVEPGSPVQPQDLIEHVKASLSSYKAPKTVIIVDTIGRAPNGKVDYKRAKQIACDSLGINA